MANPKVSVPASAIPTGTGGSNVSTASIPAELFSDITTALLSANAIPRIQAALQNELDATGWTTRVRKRVLQLLREEHCNTYDEVMRAILTEVKAGTDRDGKDAEDDDNDDDGSGQDADAHADGDESDGADGDEKDKSDKDAENDGDSSVEDGDDDGVGDDEDDKDDRGSVTSKSTAKNRRKSNASNAAITNGTSGSMDAANKKRKARFDAGASGSKDKSRRHRQEADTRGIKVPKRAVKEGLRVVRKELEDVCEIVPDTSNDG